MEKNKKAPFYVLAEKLLENLRIMNEDNECQNCKKIIDKNIRVCPYCGSIIENKKIYEENLDYIRAYINDVRYTQNQIIHELEHYIKRLVRIIRTLKLKLGYEICPRCSGTGKTTLLWTVNDNMKQKCPKCNGEGLIE